MDVLDPNTKSVGTVIDEWERTRYSSIDRFPRPFLANRSTETLVGVLSETVARDL